jgi:cyanophycin synthetase
MTGPTAARIVLSDPAVDVAVLETARGGLLPRRHGRAARWTWARCSTSSPTTSARRAIDTLDQLALIKRTVVEVATDTAVLNADDPRTLRMAAHTSATHVCYVTMDPGHQLVGEHIRAGGRAVALERGPAAR